MNIKLNREQIEEVFKADLLDEVAFYFEESEKHSKKCLNIGDAVIAALESKLDEVTEEMENNPSFDECDDHGMSQQDFMMEKIA